MDRKFEITRAGGFETIEMKGVHYTRKIHGIASSDRMNSHNYSLLADGCMATLPVPLLSKHAEYGDPIGEVYFLRKGGGKIYVRAGLNGNRAADYIWDLIVKGKLRCFSGAAEDNGKKFAYAEGYKFIDRWRLKEVSICQKGANADCHFEILQ